MLWRTHLCEAGAFQVALGVVAATMDGHKGVGAEVWLCGAQEALARHLLGRSGLGIFSALARVVRSQRVQTSVKAEHNTSRPNMRAELQEPSRYSHSHGLAVLA